MASLARPRERSRPRSRGEDGIGTHLQKVCDQRDLSSPRRHPERCGAVFVVEGVDGGAVLDEQPRLPQLALPGFTALAVTGDAGSLLLVAGIVATTAVAAVCVPANRARRVTPLEALRQE